MKTPNLFVAILLSVNMMNASQAALAPTDALLLDHLEGALPAHLEVVQAQFKVVGGATKVRARVVVRAVETLYAVESTPGPTGAGETRLLRGILARGETHEVSLVYGLALAGNGDSWVPGAVDPNAFVGLGKPRREFAADIPTEDSATGRAILGRQEAAQQEAADDRRAKQRKEKGDRTYNRSLEGFKLLKETAKEFGLVPVPSGKQPKE